MSSSREESPDPDWLRSFEAPTTSLVSLSSLSKSSPDDSPYRESEITSSLPVPDYSEATVILEKESAESLSRKTSKTKVVTEQVSIEQVFSRKKKADASLDLDGKHNGSEHKDTQQGGNDSVCLVSSDSEPSSSDPVKQEMAVPIEKDEDFVLEAKEGESAVKKGSKEKSPNSKPKSGRKTPKKENSEQEIIKNEDKDTDAIIAEEVTTDQKIKPSSGSSSRLPLVLSEKVNRTKVLVECEGDSIDLSGDMGAVGRVVVSDTTGDMYLDLKGTIYKSTIVPSRTFCIVNVGQSEAKIEAIMNDFIQLTPQSNVYEAETMVEGTLEGFLFESDDEGNKNTKTASKPDDQSEGAKEVAKTKAKAKAKAKGENVLGKKRGNSAPKKQQPAKKARNSVPKKPKTKK
ncbi:DNA-binding protein BIN4 [Cardamine amara subsp. amara]|uniref:DNA-binding protein BIN4 n=1 Tax=Cardamine amara subsp. amara TaxID=228776 RepID=A0ABD1BLW6_CARAN